MTLAALLACAIGMALPLHAEILDPSDPMQWSNFGGSISASGNNALVTTSSGNYDGAAYYYKDLNGKSGTVVENVKLTANATDQALNANFGYSSSLFGDNALVGALGLRMDDKSYVGAAYYFKGLNGKSGAVTENVKLVANAADQTQYASFGSSVSLLGDNALVGATGAYVGGQFNIGAAYYYKDLNGKSGTVTENIKLVMADVPTDGSYAYFGSSTSLSGDNALVGASALDSGGVKYVGAAYYYKNLSSHADGATVTEDVKLMANAVDRLRSGNFGGVSSLSGDSALVTAVGLDVDGKRGVGAAYYYKNLDTKSGTVTEDVKLMANAADQTVEANFGTSGSLSGDSALVGAANLAVNGESNAGAVYYYKDLNNKSGVVTEDIKFTASDAQSDAGFGSSVSMDGNAFAIGSSYASSGQVLESGKAYSGDIRAFTKLDSGNTKLYTGGLSAVSQGDFIIGETTSGNQVTINLNVAGTGANDVIDITAAGKAVYIGKQAGANNNTLWIDGQLIANEVFVGAEGNHGNTLIFGVDYTVPISATVHLAEGNTVGFKSDGSELDFVDLVQSFAGMNSELLVSGITVDADNASTLLTKWYDAARDITYFGNGMVPEPATYAAICGAAITGYALLLRRRRATSIRA